MLPEWFQIAFVFFYGSVAGSFAGVVYSRLPKMARRDLRSVLVGLSYPPSACPACGHRIRWFENIPVFSYLFLRGRCSSCRGHIPADHFWVELGCGVLALGAWAALKT